MEPIVLGVFILHFVLFVNYKDSEYFLFLRYLIPILLLTIVGYLTLPISGGFKLRNFGGTKLRITFDLDKDDPKHSIMNLKADKGGRIRFSVEVNYAPLILSDEYLCNMEHYELSDPKFKLISVERIKEYKKYSHLLTFETEHVHPTTLDVIINKVPPTWPELYNDDEGNEITEDNADKTFGIKYMAEGIASALNKKNYYTRMTININK